MVVRRSLVLLLAGALAGCPHDEQPLWFHLKIAPRAAAGPFDPSQPDPQPPTCDAAATQEFPWAGQTVRLTILKRDGAVSGAHLRDYSVVCDKVFAQASDFDVPLKAGLVSLRVESFSGTQLWFTGYRENVDLGASDIEVVLRPTAAAKGYNGPTSCSTPMARRRAFHSATLLPNGRVLIVGGLVADQGAGSASTLDVVEPRGIFASSTVEYYDPNTGTSHNLNVQGLQARAFHQAVLLDSSATGQAATGTYQVLLVGGVAPADNREAVWLKYQRTAYPFLLNPDSKATAARAQLLVLETPKDSVDGDPSVTVQEYPGIPAVLFPTAGLYDDLVSSSGEWMVGGGAGTHVGVFDDPAALYPNINASRGFGGPTSAYWLQLSRQINAGDPVVGLTRARAGHAVARLDANRYLLMGGNLDSDSASPALEIVDKSGKTTISPAVQPEYSAWHTLTPLGKEGVSDDQKRDPAGAVLWAGGFLLVPDAPWRITQKFESRAKPAQWIDGDPPALHDLAGALPKEAIGGYLDATRLADGSVLLSGGTGAPAGVCSSVLCPSRLMAVVARTDSGVQFLSDPVMALVVPRFGHRAVRLLDNSVLITGGVTKIEANTQTKQPEKLLFLSHTELVNPRTGKAPEDSPLFRTGVADSGNKVCPASSRSK
jgi:hypothetical protein